MLGRGLESLIPPRDGNNGSQDAGKRSNEPVVGNLGERGNQTEAVHAASSGAAPTTPSQNSFQGEEAVTPVHPFRKAQEGTAIFHIEVDKIKPNPHQPRRNFDEVALGGLAASIRDFGVLQPLLVSKVEKEAESGTSVEYELIAGERRLLAAKMAGLRTVPVIIRQPQLEREKLELAIIENIQRADLNPIEAARAFARLQDEFRLTQREIASRLGKSREVIANSVRLLNLPSEIQEAVASGKLNESQARLLLTIEDIPRQRGLFGEILRDNLSVRDIRSRLKATPRPSEEGGHVPSRTVDPEMEALKEQLEEFLGTAVEFTRSGKSGRITINFYSPEELESIIAKLLERHKNTEGGFETTHGGDAGYPFS